MDYLARCHCGLLTVRYRTALDPSLWQVRACQCSFCRSHGSLMTSDPKGELEFCNPDPEQVLRYRFGGRTADLKLRKRFITSPTLRTINAARASVLAVERFEELPRNRRSRRKRHAIETRDTHSPALPGGTFLTEELLEVRKFLGAKRAIHRQPHDFTCESPCHLPPFTGIARACLRPERPKKYPT
jgi:hypothetical protein